MIPDPAALDNLWAMVHETPVHRAHPVTSGAYCLAYDNQPRAISRAEEAALTFIRAKVTCAACLETYETEGERP